MAIRCSLNVNIDVTDLKKTQNVGHHDRFGRERGSDDTGDGLVRNVSRRHAKLAFIFRCILYANENRDMVRY